MTYIPPSYVEVSKKALLHNLRAYEDVARVPVAPVIKSYAYGHGLVEVACILSSTNVPFFIVDSFDEVETLRRAKITHPILVIGYVPVQTIVTDRHTEVIYVISSMVQLKALARLTQKRTRIHLKVDTGMSRQGIHTHELEAALALIKKHSRLRLEGVCSHFADADGDTDVHTHEQITRWNDVVARTRQLLPSLPWFHISATAGSYYVSACDVTLARLGIGLYGFDMSKAHLPVRPALRVLSTLCNVKQVPAGVSVGYNGTFTAPRAMTIATIPLGYYEGIDRRLSNVGCVYVRGVKCPIIGRVSMNITTIDISNVSKLREGEVVEVIGIDPKKDNTIVNVAALCHSIPYDILVGINPILHRVVRT